MRGVTALLRLRLPVVVGSGEDCLVTRLEVICEDVLLPPGSKVRPSPLLLFVVLVMCVVHSSRWEGTGRPRPTSKDMTSSAVIDLRFLGVSGCCSPSDFSSAAGFLLQVNAVLSRPRRAFGKAFLHMSNLL